MLIDWIEPGQRLHMKTGGASAVVEVLAAAVVPAGYWVCRDEASGQRRVVARTVLFPMVQEATVNAASMPAPVMPAPIVPAPIVPAPIVPAAA